MSGKRSTHAFDSIEATSDSMVEIQIEESLVRETLMTIDSANSREDFITLAAFFCVIILTALAGLYGPPASMTFRKDRLVTNTEQETIRYKSNSISSLNRHLSLSFALERRQKEGDLDECVSVSYVVECKYDGIQAKVAQDRIERACFKCVSGAAVTTSLELFSDNSVSYNEIIVSVSVSGNLAKYSALIVDGVAGVREHTIFQMYVRVLFSFFAVVFFVLFIFRLRSMPVKLWHLEQRLTVPLLALDCLFCDPFFVFDAYWPSSAFVIYDAICCGVFKSYVCFFVLTLFDSLRYKNRRTDKCFFVPKFLFTAVLFGVLTYRELRNRSLAIEPFLWVAYYAWAIYSIIVASLQVDITERYKFNMYLIAVASSMALTFTGNVLFVHLKLALDTSIHFALSFAVENMFVLLMACFHWPFEVLHDHSFMDNKSASEIFDGTRFFPSLDSDN